MKKRLAYLIFSSLLIFFIANCASDYSSLKNDLDKGASIIILAPPQKITSAFLELIDKTFGATLIRSVDQDKGKIVFENYSIEHGDVAVTIELKSATGTNKKGEVVKGHLLDIKSQGIGITAAMDPHYAIRQINNALPGILEKYKLSFIMITNPKAD